jgi:hypothetical protein
MKAVVWAGTFPVVFIPESLPMNPIQQDSRHIPYESSRYFFIPAVQGFAPFNHQNPLVRLSRPIFKSTDALIRSGSRGPAMTGKIFK